MEDRAKVGGVGRGGQRIARYHRGVEFKVENGVVRGTQDWCCSCGLVFDILRFLDSAIFSLSFRDLVCICRGYHFIWNTKSIIPVNIQRASTKPGTILPYPNTTLSGERVSDMNQLLAKYYTTQINFRPRPAYSAYFPWVQPRRSGIFAIAIIGMPITNRIPQTTCG